MDVELTSPILMFMGILLIVIGVVGLFMYTVGVTRFRQLDDRIIHDNKNKYFSDEIIEEIDKINHNTLFHLGIIADPVTRKVLFLLQSQSISTALIPEDKFQVSRSQIITRLVKLERMGLVEFSKTATKDGYCKAYSLTEKGDAMVSRLQTTQDECSVNENHKVNNNG